MTFKEADVYKCTKNFGYCEEMGRCTSPTCPNYPTPTTEEAKGGEA